MTANVAYGVKLRRTQCEQTSSGLPLKADIAQYSRHVSNVPPTTAHRQRYCSITSSARVSGAPSAVWKDSRSLFLQKGRPAGLGTAWMGKTALAIVPIRHELS